MPLFLCPRRAWYLSVLQDSPATTCLARADENGLCNAHENMGIASLLPPHSGLALALVLFPGARALPRQGSSSVVDAGAHSVRRWTPPNPTQGCSQWLWFAGLHEGRNAGGCTTHGTGSGYYAQYSAALASAQHYAGTVLVPVLLLGRFGLANSSQLSPFGRWATSKGVVVFPVARLDFQEDLVRTLSHLKKGNDHLMGPFLSPSHREHHAGSPRAVILAST